MTDDVEQRDLAEDVPGDADELPVEPARAEPSLGDETPQAAHPEVDKLADRGTERFQEPFNIGLLNPRLDRDTTPGFQQNKWERGTLMPR
jgi:hypothetical protein